MLQKSLFTFSHKTKHIFPRFIKDSSLLDEFIAIPNAFVGQSYGSFSNFIDDFNNDNEVENLNEMTIGMVQRVMEIIQRFCVINPLSMELNPIQIRSELWNGNYVCNDCERSKRMNQVAAKYQIHHDLIPKAMFGDLEENQIIHAYNVPSSNKIQELYNQEIVRHLLKNSNLIRIKLKSGFQEIFWAIKRLGLMYELDGQEITISGPDTLFSNTIRYGNAFSSLFSILTQQKEWQILAKVTLEINNSERIYECILISNEGIPFHQITEENTDISFDSNVEESFYREFIRSNENWLITRESNFLPAGKKVIIPDFCFSHKFLPDLSIQMEIMGFWTPAYIQNKLEKLSQVKTPLILAVNSTLNCSLDDFIQYDIIFYSKTVPVNQISKILSRLEKDYIEKYFHNHTIPPISNIPCSIISIQELSSLWHIPTFILKTLNFTPYFLLDDYLIHEKKLREMTATLPNRLQFNEANQWLVNNKLPMKALELVGYKVKFQGLFPSIVIKN